MAEQKNFGSALRGRDLLGSSAGATFEDLLVSSKYPLDANLQAAAFWRAHFHLKSSLLLDQ
jgi:hypothetical protein